METHPLDVSESMESTYTDVRSDLFAVEHPAAAEFGQAVGAAASCKACVSSAGTASTVGTCVASAATAACFSCGRE